MKKTVQNVLAQNSNNEIAYLCGKCGREVKKESVRCIHCGARLGNIKCPFCGFTGSVEDFSEDTCPRCGRKKSVEIENRTGKTQVPKPVIKHSFFQRCFWIILAVLTILTVAVFFAILKRFEIFF
jgi:predicted RNA-binding Zn-ribbon protein involved in translation (DUF1610 family)